jgi:LmbE family N-acetylglucosaminyl deacetylase
VFAPHPDDESLACGGLIQRAQRAGAVVSVVIATNGDANPWPQRLIEKRWNLGPDAARRWGAVRHAEATAALQALGISIDNARFLQWADQGLTKRLMDDGNASVEQLRQLIATHRPTLVAMPSMLDSHPDHSALALMLMAALRGENSQARAISYWLHGRNGQQLDVSHVALTQEEMVGKRAAALAHVSQTRFGTSRLLRFVAPTEGYIQPSMVAPQSLSTWRWQLRAHGRLGVVAARRLHIVAMTAHGVIHAATLELPDARKAALQFKRLDARTMQIEMPALWLGSLSVVAKLDTNHRINVYDEFGWTQCESEDKPSAINPDSAESDIRQQVPGERLTSVPHDAIGITATSLRVTVK